MVTFFLATVMGWYFIILSLYMLFKHENLRLVMTDILEQRALFFFVAIVTLIIGLLLVVSHNIWVLGWPLIITLFSWLILISGLIRIFYPETARKMANSFLSHPKRIKITGVVMFIIGIWLLFCVYYYSF